MIHLITFTDHRMTISAMKLMESAGKHGVDEVKIYDPSQLPETFIQMAMPTINVSKGAGLYIWKPFIIWDYMQECSDGEYLIYADAGQTLVNSVRPVIDGMDQDIMMFSNGWKHVEWCKMDVADAINHELTFESTMTKFGPIISYYGNYPDHKQTQASLIFFKVTPESRNFVKEWMLWSLMPGFCDDSPSKLHNYPTFQETRWDQSILCCLQIKYGYRLHWFPTTTAHHIRDGFPKDHYPEISLHHRKRNEEW